MKAAVALLIVFVAILSMGLSKKQKGVIDEDESKWVFLTRFCFLSLEGKLAYDFAYPKKYGVQNLLFYYDTPGQWEAAIRGGKTCQERVDVMNNDNIFPLDVSQCRTEVRNNEPWYRCRNIMGFRSARERWWYLVVERCDAPDSSEKTLYLEYDIHMTNGDDLLHKEFSADQFYILPVDIIFFVIYIALLGASIVVAVLLRNRHMYHTTYKMYLASVSIWTIGLLFLVIAWGSYGNTGWERSSMEVFGRILQTAATVVFVLQLVLMAKGYTIVRGRLTNKAMLKIFVFILLYSSFSVIFYIWEAYFFDPRLVLYYYESPPGYCLIGMQLLGWLWMTKAAVFTLKHYSKSTSSFFIPFYVIYTLWFWVGPLVTMLAMMVMPKWTREKTVHGVQQLIALMGHLFFFTITAPCKVNKNFPYSIKTSQISDANPEIDSNAADMYTINNQVEYEGTGPNLDIFMTSTQRPGEESNFSGRMYGPLDTGILNSSGTPPPNYSEAMSPKPLPTIGSQEYDSGHSSSEFPDVRGPSQADNLRNGHLPPITTQLPPIRASGLPPIVPSAPAGELDGDLGRDDPTPLHPPSYAEMFQVNK